MLLLLWLLEEENDAVKERDDLRYERHKDRERERRIARAAPERRAKLERARDRDVTEQIALGKPAGPPSQEALFDQRLFNQTKVHTHNTHTHTHTLTKDPEV